MRFLVRRVLITFLLLPLFSGLAAPAQQSPPIGIRPDGRVFASGKNYRAYGGFKGWCRRAGGPNPGWVVALQIEFDPQVRVPKDPDWYVAFLEKTLLPAARKQCGAPLDFVSVWHFWKGYLPKELDFNLGSVGSAHLSRMPDGSWKVQFQGLQSMVEHGNRGINEKKAIEEAEECSRLSRLRKEGRLNTSRETEEKYRKITAELESLWVESRADENYRGVLKNLIKMCSDAYHPACYSLQKKQDQAAANCTGRAEGRTPVPLACGLWAYVLDTLPPLCFEHNYRFGVAGPNNHWVREAYKKACEGGETFYCERLRMMDTDPLSHLETPG